MKKKLFITIFVGLMTLSGLSAFSQNASNNAIISQIKLNQSYISATGTAKINDEAMSDARDRLKTEIYEWLNSVLNDKDLGQSKIENYKNWMKGMVRMQTDIRKRPTFNDTVQAYAGVISQGDDIRFIDRKVGSLLRVFAYVSKNKILPGIINEDIQVDYDKIENASNKVVSNETETSPVNDKTEGTTKIESVNQEDNSPEVIAQVELKEQAQPIENISTEISVTEEPVKGDVEEIKNTSDITLKAIPDPEIVKGVEKLKTAGEVEKFLVGIKQKNLLLNYGQDSKSFPENCYLVLIDSHKIVRSRLWYDGKNFSNLNSGETADLTNLLNKYPVIIWFQTK